MLVYRGPVHMRVGLPIMDRGFATRAESDGLLNGPTVLGVCEGEDLLLFEA